ncbi:MAG: hypothetical protein AABY07_06890 [Nanoarchaeota archaeon]
MKFNRKFASRLLNVGLLAGSIGVCNSGVKVFMNAYEESKGYHKPSPLVQRMYEVENELKEATPINSRFNAANIRYQNLTREYGSLLDNGILHERNLHETNREARNQSSKVTGIEYASSLAVAAYSVLGLAMLGIYKKIRG